MFPFPVLFLSTQGGGVVPLPEGIVKKVVSISYLASGYQNSVAVLLSDGRLFTQGENVYGELADGTLLANNNNFHLAASDIDDVFNGDRCFIVKRKDGSWRYSGSGEGLNGAGSSVTSFTALPSQITNAFSLADISNITGANGNTLWLLKNGSLFGSGTNANSCLGTGNSNSVVTPRAIASGVKKMASIFSNATYLTNSGSMMTCGTLYRIGGASAPSGSSVFRAVDFTGTGDTVFVKDFSISTQQVFVIGSPSISDPVSYFYASGITSADYRKVQEYAAGFSDGFIPAGNSSYHIVISGEFLALGLNSTGALGTGDKNSTTVPLVPVYPFKDKEGWDASLVQQITQANLTSDQGASFLVYNHNLFMSGASKIAQSSFNGTQFKNISEFNT